MANVVMLIHEEHGRYGASFPDFPGCTTVAGGLDEVYRRAAEVLPFHAEALIEEDRLPRIRTLEALRNDPDFKEDAADAALIGFVNVELRGRSVRVNITVEESALERIDRAAAAAGESRSAYLVKAALDRARSQAGRKKTAARGLVDRIAVKETPPRDLKRAAG